MIIIMAANTQLLAVSQYFQSPYHHHVSFSEKDQIPMVKARNGNIVSGLATVARHLSHTGKISYDLTLEEQAAVDQWLEYHVVHHKEQSHQNIQTLTELNSFLADKVFFVTDHPTVADIIMYHGLYKIFAKLAFQEKEKYIHLSRWINNNQLDTTSNTHLKTDVPVSRSLPLTDGAIEWEPGVRGSLRRLRGTLNPILIAQDKPSSANGSHFDSSFEDSPQAVGFQPVQGQKRSTVDNRNRKARKPNGDPKGGKNSNCKQQ